MCPPPSGYISPLSSPPPLVLSSTLCLSQLSPLLSQWLFPVRIKWGSVLNPWTPGRSRHNVGGWGLCSCNFQFSTSSRNTCPVGLTSGSPSGGQELLRDYFFFPCLVFCNVIFRGAVWGEICGQTWVQRLSYLWDRQQEGPEGQGLLLELGRCSGENWISLALVLVRAWFGATGCGQGTISVFQESRKVGLELDIARVKNGSMHVIEDTSLHSLNLRVFPCDICKRQWRWFPTPGSSTKEMLSKWVFQPEVGARGPRAGHLIVSWLLLQLSSGARTAEGCGVGHSEKRLGQGRRPINAELGTRFPVQRWVYPEYMRERSREMREEEGRRRWDWFQGLRAGRRRRQSHRITCHPPLRSPLVLCASTSAKGR